MVRHAQKLRYRIMPPQMLQSLASLRDIRRYAVIAVLLAACHPIADAPVRSPPREATAHAGDSVEVLWVGHSTVLVRLGDRWILTDPVFSEGIGGGLVRRYVRPGIDIDDLPPVDWVVISHAHADHLDVPSLERLGPGADLVVPPGLVNLLPRSLPVRDVHALDKWKSIERDGVRVTAVPARHANARWVVDGIWRRRAHAGFVVERGPHTLYFAGDTGYDAKLFREIGRRFDIDVALIPVGPADRAGWVHRLRRHVHVSPEEALRIFDDVGAQWMVPIHFGTFWKRDAGEQAAVEGAIAAHPRSEWVRLLKVGESATFRW